MKILELHYSTACAGAERFVVDLCNELSRQHDVTLCTIVDDRIEGKAYYLSELSSSVKYINLGCKSGLDIRYFWKVISLIRTVKPDCVHAHTDAINLWLPSILFPKIKFFLTLHSLANKRQLSSLLTSVYKFFYKKYIHAITISLECFDSYRKLYGLDNASMIENGRASMCVTEAVADVKAEIDSLKQHTDDKVYIHVARCAPAKNEPLLFRTFNRFLVEGHHAILIIIGGNYDSAENRYLLDSATKGIYWLGTKPNVCDYLMNADFFVLSSLWEGMPISLLEAMSVGVIPVCTPAGGICDVITEPSLGFLSTGFEDADFYNAVESAYTNEPNFNRQALVDRFNTRYSIHRCASQYADVFTNKQ